MTPVLPSEFRALEVKPSDTLGTAIVKTFVRLPVLLYKWYRYAFKPNGTMTQEFSSEICEACAKLKERT